jgi:hypothetical protein
MHLTWRTDRPFLPGSLLSRRYPTDGFPVEIFKAKARPESLLLQLVRREDHLTEGKPNWKIAEPGEADQPVSDHRRRHHVKLAMSSARP